MNIQNRFTQETERKVRETLESKLEAGETLLEYCQGKYTVGIWSSQEFWIGLTQQRFILINRKNRNKVSSIGLAFIQGVTKGRVSKYNSKPVLQIALYGFQGDTSTKISLAFTLYSFWIDHGARMAEQYTSLNLSWENRPLLPTIPQTVELIKDLEKMGADNEAQALLKARFTTDPYFAADGDAKDLYHQVTEEKLAMRIAAVIYGVVILFLVWFAIQGQAMIGFGIVIAVIAIYSLIRGNPAARRSALALALLTVFFNIILNLMANSLVDTIMWAAFGLSMCLLLVGKPNRLRIISGAGVFAVGSVGLLVLFWLGMQSSPESFQWLLPAPKEPFTEDFSAIHKWAVENNDQAAVNLEKGAYYLTIKKPQVVYFSFPPISYFPIQGEVDAWVPGDDADTNHGFFGLVCRYQKEAEKYYIVYIDPIKEKILVERMRGKDETVLTDPTWQAAKGLKDANVTNRIALSCQDNKVSLTINGVQQTPIEDPEMAAFGDGRLGLMAAALSPDSAQGFKVMFDNAKFWPPK